MQALDAVNDRWGGGGLKFASGKVSAAPQAWGIEQDRKSLDDTTSWEGMPAAKA